MPRRFPRATWIGGDRRSAHLIAQPVLRFLGREASGGILLLVATGAALAWVNSPWGGSYVDLWHSEIAIHVAGFTIREDLRHWVNDGLMAIFFFVVGLEVKRELVTGELASPRAAALPAVAAVGGMVLPAAIFLAVNAGGSGASGWGIPMATDIAFAVGVLAALGDRAPGGLKVLLLSIAIVDDIGAIVVIAVFYSGGLDLRWLAAAAVGLIVVALLRHARVWYLPVYVVLGVAIWVATFESGVHATIAGVALGLLTPVRPLLPQPEADRVTARLSADSDVTADDLRELRFGISESVPVGERLEALLHPWSVYVIIPVFALANAGIELSDDGLQAAFTSPITIGVVIGLVVGKVAGIGGAIWLAVRFGLSPLPDGVRWPHVVGMATIAGIGFTVSIFITNLAFDDSALRDEAKLGVLVASAAAATIGALVLARTSARSPLADRS